MPDPDADPESSEAAPSIFVRAGQFFLIPLGIVLVCCGVYLFFSYMVGERGSPETWLEQIRTGGLQSRRQAVHALIAELRRQDTDKRLDVRLVEPIYSTYKALSPEDREIRLSLLMALGILKDRRAVGPLVEELQRTPDNEERAACIAALGAMKAVEAGEVLIKLLDHESSIVRKYATFNLGAIAAPVGSEGDKPALPEAIPHLRRKLEDPRAEVSWNAAVALAVFLKDRAGLPVLLKMLDRKEIEGAVGADAEGPALVGHAMAQGCHAIAELKEKSAVDALRKLETTDPDPQVRRAAGRAIQALR